MKRKALLYVATIALVAVFVPAGCSDADKDEAATEDHETTQPADSSGSDGSSQAVAPVIVESGEPITLNVGQQVDVTTDGVTEIATSDDEVMSVSQPYDDGSAEFNAGAIAKAPGSTTLSVYNGDDVLYEVNVTVRD